MLQNTGVVCLMVTIGGFRLGYDDPPRVCQTLRKSDNARTSPERGIPKPQTPRLYELALSQLGHKQPLPPKKGFIAPLSR